jgi:Big-like domain-containing protein
VNTTAVFTPPTPATITICINYSGLKFTSPSAITIQHFQGGSWVSVPTTTDTTKESACGNVSSLSPFALFEPVVPAPATITATGGGSQSASVYSAMTTPLQATVTDSNGNPVSGVQVTFAAPAVEPTGGFSGASFAFANTNAAGVAVAPTFTADGFVGSYTVTASVDGVSTPANYALKNLQGGTSVQLTTSPASPVGDGTPVVLTANVSSAAGGVPTGSVNFLNSTTSLGNVPLLEGVATLTTSALPQGNNNIQATYAGDANFSGSNSAVETVSVNAPDYTLSASATSATLGPGQSTNPPITLTVTPAGYSGTVTLSCGTLPSYIACTFNPSSGALTFVNGATADQTIQLTVAVASTSTSAMLRRDAPVVWAMLAPLSLLALLPAIGGDRKQLRRCLGMMVLAFFLGGVVSGCSSRPSSKLPPAGTQTITVTASGPSPTGTISHQLQLKITVTN